MLNRTIYIFVCYLAVAQFVPQPAFAAPLDSGSTLCLYPVALPFGEGEEDVRRIDLERRLINSLTVASYQIPDPQSVSDIVERVQEEVGGIVDASTGRRHKKRYRLFRNRLKQVLQEELACDAQISAQIALVRASFVSGIATWDGARESINSVGRNILNILSGTLESGWVLALSLRIRAFDFEGNDVAYRAAGIESVVSLAVLQDKDLLPEDLWLTNGDKLTEAIESALGSDGSWLRDRGTPTSANR